MATELAVLTIEQPPELSERLATLDSESLTTFDEICKIKVVNQESYDLAVAQGRLLATAEGEWGDEMDRVTGEAYSILTGIRSVYNAAIKKAKEGKQYLAGECGKFTREQERKRQEEERKRQEEHRKQEEEARINAALKAEEVGLKPESVERILSSPITTTAPLAPQTYQKAAGTSGRIYWMAYVSNDEPDAARAALIAKKALVAAAAQNDELLAFLDVDQRALNREADNKKMLFKIPGYRALSQPKTSFRKF